MHRAILCYHNKLTYSACRRSGSHHASALHVLALVGTSSGSSDWLVFRQSSRQAHSSCSNVYHLEQRISGTPEFDRDENSDH